jgi:hypothetical protein
VNGAHFVGKRSKQSDNMDRQTHSKPEKASGRRMYVQHGKYQGCECLLDSMQSVHEEAEGSKVKITLLPSMKETLIRRDYLIDASEADFRGYSKALERKSEKVTSATTRGWLRANIRYDECFRKTH